MIGPLYFFWPRKAVPSWLEDITCEDCTTVRHGGFGLVMSRGGVFHALVLCGAFLRIDGPGWVEISGGGGGVIVSGGLRSWLSGVLATNGGGSK